MSIRKHLRSAWKRKSFGKKKKGGVFEYYLRISLLHSVSITWVGMRKEHAGQISKTPNRLKEAFFFFFNVQGVYKIFHSKYKGVWHGSWFSSGHFNKLFSAKEPYLSLSCIVGYLRIKEAILTSNPVFPPGHHKTLVGFQIYHILVPLSSGKDLITLRQNVQEIRQFLKARKWNSGTKPTCNNYVKYYVPISLMGTMSKQWPWNLSSPPS